jgi:uncharacterized protein (TIGR00251 family)
VSAASDGVRVALRVAPKSSANRILGCAGEADGGRVLKIAVTAAPEDGKANEAVRRLLAERLRISGGSVTLVSGPANRDKIVELTGIDAAEVERRLEQTR